VHLISAETATAAQIQSYLLRSGSHHPTLGNTSLPGGLQNHLEQMHDRIIADPPRHFL
jgi:hypothetical protein